MLQVYADKLSVKPGEAVRFMISTDHAAFTSKLVRLLHGDPHPTGPGLQTEATEWVEAGPHPGKVQELRLGSYLSLPAPERALSSFTFVFRVLPTSPIPHEENLVYWGDGPDATALDLRFDSQWRIVGRVWGADSGEHTIDGGRPLLPWRWNTVVVSFDADQRAFSIGNRTIKTQFNAIRGSARPWLLGAALGADGIARARFNGKISHPILFDRALDEFGVHLVNLGQKPPAVRCLGEWDLSLGISSNVLKDISGNEKNGQAHNGPARGVTGPGWSGPYDKCYSEAPHEYDAIHLHDDDLEDAGWQPTLQAQIPTSARSGLYSLQLSAGSDQAWGTFVVRGQPQPGSARVLLTIPTLTWHAYTNMGTPPCGLSIYTPHHDGTPNYYATLRKPITSWAPNHYFQGMGALKETYSGVRWCTGAMASLYAIHWLEHCNIAYDVLTDHDLHREGHQALKPYPVVINAGHHEYWTEEMLDALKAYVAHGGRVMHLVGNGLYWVSTLDPNRPHILEVRKSGLISSNVDGLQHGRRTDFFSYNDLPGERQHSTIVRTGGMWRDNGRPPQQLAGVGFSVMGLNEKGSGFRRLNGSFDPRAAFVFEGIGRDEIIGDFGLNQGGAAGIELDRADAALGTPSGALLLASSFGHAPSFIQMAEDGTGCGPQGEGVRADMVYIEHPAGGRVFSVGSISWTGSLSHNAYNNNVARITNNVLKEFLGK